MKKTLMQRLRKSTRGQTALEYAMMLVVVMVPTAIAVKEVLKEISGDQGLNSKKETPVKKMVTDAYGDESRMGVIGRPYP
ncbi:MAG: hypothetical protein J0L93_00040 [Deltaproteobacteria bacterium]|nr:hypothetical protein [Deltaproteobacteria bacterium]